jgi:extracellular solute-binding protein
VLRVSEIGQVRCTRVCKAGLAALAAGAGLHGSAGPDVRSGRFDAALMHLNRAREAHLPFITLPDQINLGDPALASTYATATYIDPVTGAKATARPDVYTVTIPSTVQNPAGALAFVLFLLSHKGQDILVHGGLLRTPFVISGDQGSVPSAVLQSIQQNQQGHQGHQE